MKKRLIFTLLYEKGSFVLSRNFRTQKIGDARWLGSHYNFEKAARFIDELILINVSRDRSFDEHFRETLSEVVSGVFVPVAAGGGVRTIDDATSLFKFGADKILVNRAIFEDPDLVSTLSQRFGQQALVGSVDVRRAGSDFQVYTDKGTQVQPADRVGELVSQGHLGELYLNSIDRDGTGQGMDPGIAGILDNSFQVPLILAGGAGKPEHLLNAITLPYVNAVATANLLNFIGDGLRKTRESIVNAGVELAQWE